jgi:phosphoribosyl-ATP pyrophosphohydrolase
MEKKILERLYDLIAERKSRPEENSYTCHLFQKGKDEILKKVGEEAIEVIIASKGQTKEETVRELADLLYHTLVLMAEDGITLENLYAELEKRFGKSDLKIHHS